MSDFWSKSIKIVGLPGLVLYVFYFVIDKIFDEKITNFLGINRFFILILIILVLLAIFFIYSTLKTAKTYPTVENDDTRPPDATNNETKAELPSSTPSHVKIQTVEYKDNARHEGDNNFS
ncbi:hypothetical protein SMC00_001945 [Cronobacter sakazakii]|nr:hypothetical protein [Cronobacter sakazakii]ELY2758103.1 hypothetical protein [Cronobacter sakazakii]ELY3997940.1 hypothetical protein [Cronobacter sakazakii]ELY4069771.1 hypothetical protein [Cronobacter sakazakii]ELY4595483.1 hypothetical protein [Cronobacter sakazakii]